MKLPITFLLLLLSAVVLPASPILLDDFNDGSTTGAVIDGTSWAGQVVQNPGYISVAGSALDDNGWGASGLWDLSGVNALALTARVDDGNESPLVSVLFLDANLNAEVFTWTTSQFLTDSFSTVFLSISSWGALDPTQITDWSLGGGGLGLTAFRMSFDELSLKYVPPSNAVPEGGAVVTLLSMGLAGCAWLRSRKALPKAC